MSNGADTTRRNGIRPSYKFPVWNGLLEPKHRKKIGPALWEFLWCIDKITKEKDGKGYVYGGKPVTFAEIAKDLGVSEKTIQRHIDRLRATAYIELILTPRGHQIRVFKSDKFTNKPEDKTQWVSPGLAKAPSKLSTQTGQKCPPCPDNSVHPRDKSVQPNIREGISDKALEKELREGTAAAKIAPRAASLSSLIKKVARELQPPREPSQAQLDDRRRSLLRQVEEIQPQNLPVTERKSHLWASAEERAAAYKALEEDMRARKAATMSNSQSVSA